jgi:hypothetical protein
MNRGPRSAGGLPPSEEETSGRTDGSLNGSREWTLSNPVTSGRFARSPEEQLNWLKPAGCLCTPCEQLENSCWRMWLPATKRVCSQVCDWSTRWLRRRLAARSMITLLHGSWRQPSLPPLFFGQFAGRRGGTGAGRGRAVHVPGVQFVPAGGSPPVRTRGARRRPAAELHVTHWDRLGWPDTFGLEVSMRRQELYADWLGLGRLYTPPMV